MRALRSFAGLVVLAVAGTASAQMMGPGGMMGRGMGGSTAIPRSLHCDAAFGMRSAMGQGMVGYGASAVDPRPALRDALDRLQSQLGISAAQLPAWNAYVAALLDQADDLADLRDEMLATPRTAIEWNRRHAEFMLQRAQGALRIADAMAALHAQLTSAQRATFEATYGPCTVLPTP